MAANLKNINTSVQARSTVLASVTHIHMHTYKANRGESHDFSVPTHNVQFLMNLICSHAQKIITYECLSVPVPALQANREHSQAERTDLAGVVVCRQLNRHCSDAG